jgi:hypothetical protein
MPKVRDVLVHVSIETALKQRICHRKRGQHSIHAGQRCLVVKDAATGGKKNYCTECAPEIIENARERLDQLRAELHS